METQQKLDEILGRIDGGGYKGYKEIKGAYQFPGFTLLIDHVQGDPFATPSRIRVQVDRKTSGLSQALSANKSRKVALCDYLTRIFYKNCLKYSQGNRGTGKSGLIVVDRPGQEILESTAMVVTGQWVEARFFMGLPAQGRRIAGRDATIMFLKELPEIVQTSLFFNRLNSTDLKTHIHMAEDADALRNELDDLGLVGFVANGALLPRTSGIDPAPLAEDRAVRFQSPDTLQKDIILPNSGCITGMGIPKGVTLIVGGGYHGKSTLLNALELGVYNHLNKDGREMVVTVPSAVKIRASDGRSVVRTDISPFISNLPFEKDTTSFSTKNASGSTSQAANITEALETGARVLLLDEDTSATNFMIRDYRMQQLVAKDKEPITPFIDKVRQLYDEKGVSTVLVMGGSGDYFSVAHQVIQMTAYVPEDVTQKAHHIAATHASGRRTEGGDAFGNLKERIPIPESFNPYHGKHRIKISAPRTDEILFGKTRIDIGDVEQIVHMSQTRGIAHALHYALRYMDGKRSLKEVVDRVITDINDRSLDILTPHVTGDIARFRSFELAAAMNRLRTLKIAQEK
ncbi:ABC-ATPase domain-containing protein [Thermodesulfobacteriota bacterium]